MLGIEEQSIKNWQKVGDEGSVSDMIRSERGWGTFSQYFLVKFIIICKQFSVYYRDQ